MTEPVVVSDDTFESEVLQSDRPVLVDFWAEWCGPCRMIAPTVRQLAAEQSAVLKVAKLDVDENPGKPFEYNVSGIPTLLLFKGGEVVARLVGAQPKDRILAQIAPHLETAAA